MPLRGRVAIMNGQAAAQAVHFAILTAHRLGEPRVLELTHRQFLDLRRCGTAADWSEGPPWSYRGLRVAECSGSCGRVLAWDRAREMDMVQTICWPAEPLSASGR